MKRSSDRVSAELPVSQRRAARLEAADHLPPSHQYSQRVLCPEMHLIRLATL